MTSVVSLIKSPSSKVLRRAFVKRRLRTTGLFESDWQEITDDVKRWGKIKISISPEKTGSYLFSAINLRVANDSGKFNPNDDPASMWFDYANMQRSLIKIETGFVKETKAGGIWTRTEAMRETSWDADKWDNGLVWDSKEFQFYGIISGDPGVNDKNTITLNVKPLTQLFVDFPARLLTGAYTTTGLTASDFMEKVRDHTDGSGSFVFRPFFQDTTTQWDIQTTTQLYLNLNTTTAAFVRSKSVWNVMEKLAQVENFVPYIDFKGVFRFKDLDTTTPTYFVFNGINTNDEKYGHTIKSIDSYGPRLESYYSRVEVKWSDDDTDTSFAFSQADLTVSGTNDPWVFGYRTFKIENPFIPDQATAQTIADNVFSELSALKKEIRFRTSYVPQVSILQTVEMNYDASEPNPGANWDENDWTTELIWDDQPGDAILLENKRFNILSVDMDLDKFGCSFVGREE